jgi:Calpain family cysteine protease
MFSKLKRLFLSPGSGSCSSLRARGFRPTLEVLEDRRLLAANLFGVGGDWRVYEQRLDYSGHASTAWFPTSSAGQIISNVSMSTDANDNMHLFGVGADGQVFEQNLDPSGNALSAWYSTAQGQIVSSVTVSPNGEHLFGVGRDGRVYEQDFNAYGQAQTGWFPTSSAGAIDSDVSISPDGRHLFAVGGDGRVYEQTLDAVSGHATTSWIPTTTGGAIDSDVSVSPDGRHLFAVGGDGRVYEQTLDASANPLTSWIPTTSGGAIVSSVTVDTDGSGGMHLFGVGADGQVYEQDLDAYGNVLDAWYSTAQAAITSDVSLVSDAYGQKHLFGRGRDGRIYEQDLNATDHAVSGWYATSSGGAITSDVSAGPGAPSSGVSVLGSLACEPASPRLYSPATGTLFGPGGPSYLDVQQGALGDCWLLASLAEVAARDPQDITNMFTSAGTTWLDGDQVSLYSVRFYDGNGVAHSVTVDTELPQGGAFCDRPVGGSGAINGSASPVLWVALAEKAYAEANRYGFVTTRNPGVASYRELNIGGDPAPVLQAITGQSAGDANVNPSDALSAWNQGKLVVFGTTSPTSSYVVGGHCYAMVNYNSSNSTFSIYNPWGTDSSGWAPGYSNTVYGLFWANAAFVSQNFATQSVGAGAAPGEWEGLDNTAGGPGTVFAGLGAGGGGSNALLASTPMSGSTSMWNEADRGLGAANDATPSPARSSSPVTLHRPDDTPGIGGVSTPGTLAFDASALILFDDASTADDKLVP